MGVFLRGRGARSFVDQCIKASNRWKIVSRLIRSFTLLLRTILNIKVTVQGDEGQLERGGYVIISNHFGYLDGIVLGSLFPVVFVSKKEVKSWPMIGQWSTLCGTVFIDRQRKDLIPLAVAEISRKLKQEANILLFPEGAATNGERMLPFQTAPLAAPLRSRAIIVPRYSGLSKYRRTTRLDGQPGLDLLLRRYADFARTFGSFSRCAAIEARVTIQPKIECFRYRGQLGGPEEDSPRIATIGFWEKR